MHASLPKSAALLTLPFVLFALFAVAVCGCQQASTEQCERIVERIVQLELKQQGIRSPALLEKRTKETLAQKKHQWLEGCVGQRISQTAIDCINRATTPEQITDSCLR